MKGKYDPIQPLYPTLDQATKDKITQDWVNAVKADRGAYVGTQKDAYGNFVPYYNDGTKDQPNYYYWRPGDTPFTDQRARVGEDYHTHALPAAPGMQEVVAQINQDPNNPFTGERFAQDVSHMKMGDLREAQMILSRFKNSIPAEGMIDDLQGGHELLNRELAVRDLLTKINPDELTTIAQLGKKFDLARMNNQDLATHGMNPELRDNYFKLLNNMELLAQQGTTVQGLPPNPKSASPVPGLAKGAMSMLSSLVPGQKGTAALGVFDSAAEIANSIANGSFDINKLVTSLPTSITELRQGLYNRTKGLADTGYRIPNQYRHYADGYAHDLTEDQMGPDDNPSDAPAIKPGSKAGVIAEPAGGAPQAAPSPKPLLEQTPWEALSGLFKRVMSGGPSVPWWQRGQTAPATGAPAQPVAQPVATPTPPVQQTEEMPEYAPIPGARAMYQYGGLVRAPVGGRPTAQVQTPSYGTQAELDAAGHPPGTRFHWKPTNQEYVKI